MTARHLQSKGKPPPRRILSRMDALDAHLESLASLGIRDGRGEFTLAEGQVWARLEQTLQNGEACLRYALRWLHRRQATSIAVSSLQPGEVSLQAELNEAFLDPSRGEEPDLSGADLDLARCAVAARLQELPPPVLRLEGPNGSWSRSVDRDGRWERGQESAPRPRVRLELSLAKSRQSTVTGWEQDILDRFQASPLPLSWDDRPISGAYRFSTPVLAWRHLRPKELQGRPLALHAPEEALERFLAARPGSDDVVLGLLAAPLPPGDCAFRLLLDGELLPLPEISRRFPGLCGLLRSPESRLDLAGEKPVWSARLQAIAASLRQEVIDMALQLFHRRPRLSSRQAESGFSGLQSVLLMLLEEQRFTEGHLLAGWLRDCLGPSSERLADFRTGYTFDRLCALLAEPAGQAQASLRWSKAADARVRETSAHHPERAEEALLITARLELRARRRQREKLSGDTGARLAQLAYRQRGLGRHAEAAANFLLLASASPSGEAARFDYLEQAAACGDLAGRPSYRERLLGERARRGKAEPSEEWEAE